MTRAPRDSAAESDDATASTTRSGPDSGSGAGADASEGLPPLEQAWSNHIARDTSLLDGLITRHRERQRRYHRLEHVEHVIRLVVELAELEAVDDLDTIVAAAFYHDAIHEPLHPSNERASARLARRDLNALGWDSARADKVGAMIEGTASHREPPDVDTAVLFDADLAILGADAADYESYATKVRAEYHHLDDAEWRAGRSDVLRSFLDRESLFATGSGRQRWEETARVNIASELAALDAA